MNKLNELGNSIVKRFHLEEQKIVVAVSTGLDSTVLLNALLNSDDLQADQLVVSHVNHQLRQQSEVEEAYLRQWCAKYQVELEVQVWPVKQHPKTGLEAAAREFRYDFFQQVMQKHHADSLLTAHNADEQAETLMMRLIRGGWLSELAGIPEQRSFGGGQLIRPLLDYRKSELLALAQQYDLKWFEDETNHELEFTRNRMRNQVMPLLEQENPKAVQHLNSYVQQISQQEVLVDELINQKLSQLKKETQFDLPSFLKESPRVQELLLLKIIHAKVQDLAIGPLKMQELLNFLNINHHSQATLDVGDAWQLVISYDLFDIAKKVIRNNQQLNSHVVTLNSWQKMDNQLEFRVKKVTKAASSSTKEVMILSENQLKLPLTIRQAQPDDQLRLPDGGYKSIRRELIDQKIANQQRLNYYVVVDDEGTVIWALGLRKAWLSSAYNEKLPLYCLEYRTGGYL